MSSDVTRQTEKQRAVELDRDRELRLVKFIKEEIKAATRDELPEELITKLSHDGGDFTINRTVSISVFRHKDGEDI